MQLIPETTGMGHKCTLTVNPDKITDLQWQAMDRTLPENLTEMAAKPVKPVKSLLHGYENSVQVTASKLFDSFTEIPVYGQSFM